MRCSNSALNMKAFNFLCQWLFWSCGLAGTAIGFAVAVGGSWTRGIVASMICFGTMVPVGNYFKARRELARLSATTDAR
jgi:O-antigen ligase